MEIQRKGKLSDKQISALNKNMKRYTVDERIKNLTDKMVVFDEVEKQKRIHFAHDSLVFNMVGNNNWNSKMRLSQKDREFLENVRDWSRGNGRNYTEKQRSAIRRIWSRYSDIPLEQVSAVFEEKEVIE